MRFCILVSAYCLLTSVAFARPEPGFDPKDVVRQVRSTNSTPGPLESLNPALDDGEFLIDTSGVHGEIDPDVAFDGTNFLVAWNDWRSSDCDIYGARVTPAGVVLDPTGIVISTATNHQWYPALAFDGTNFLVTWTDDRSAPYLTNIYGARVTPGGVVLDPQGIAISIAPSGQFGPTLAFNGTNFLVVWSDWRSGSDDDIYATRVTPGGVVLDPQGIAISTAADDQWYAALAFDGTNFLVAWTDCRNNPDTSDMYGARVSRAGTVLDPGGFPISTATGWQALPAVSFDGTNFLVVWADGGGDGYNDIYGTRVTQAGAVLDPAGIAISTAAVYQQFPALALTARTFSWSGKTTAAAATMTSTERG